MLSTACPECHQAKSRWAECRGAAVLTGSGRVCDGFPLVAGVVSRRFVDRLGGTSSTHEDERGIGEEDPLILNLNIIRNDISTNAQTLKHNINNVCNLIKLKQAI
jgi:hypothetical protein